MLENIIHGALSCICITIPEFMFMIIVTLKLMKRKELLDLYNIKNNTISILKVVIPSAFLLDILNYIIKTPPTINKTISFITLYIFLIIVLSTKEHSYVEYSKLKEKAFKYFTKSILLAIAIESITYPIILQLTNKNYEEIKLNFYLVIICSLASRIINIVIICYILIKKNDKFQMDLGDYILNNKFFMRSTSGITIGLLLYEIYFVKLIIYNNLLSVIGNIYEQLFIVIGSTFLIPALITTLVYSYINYCVMLNRCEKQTVRDD